MVGEHPSDIHELLLLLPQLSFLELLLLLPRHNLPLKLFLLSKLLIFREPLLELLQEETLSRRLLLESASRYLSLLLL